MTINVSVIVNNEDDALIKQSVNFTNYLMALIYLKQETDGNGVWELSCKLQLLMTLYCLHY